MRHLLFLNVLLVLSADSLRPADAARDFPGVTGGFGRELAKSQSGNASVWAWLLNISASDAAEASAGLYPSPERPDRARGEPPPASTSQSVSWVLDNTRNKVHDLPADPLEPNAAGALPLLALRQCEPVAACDAAAQVNPMAPGGAAVPAYAAVTWAPDTPLVALDIAVLRVATSTVLTAMETGFGGAGGRGALVFLSGSVLNPPTHADGDSDDDVTFLRLRFDASACADAFRQRVECSGEVAFPVGQLDDALLVGTVLQIALLQRARDPAPVAVLPRPLDPVKHGQLHLTTLRFPAAVLPKSESALRSFVTFQGPVCEAHILFEPEAASVHVLARTECGSQIAPARVTLHGAFLVDATGAASSSVDVDLPCSKTAFGLGSIERVVALGLAVVVVSALLCAFVAAAWALMKHREDGLDLSTARAVVAAVLLLLACQRVAIYSSLTFCVPGGCYAPALPLYHWAFGGRLAPLQPESRRESLPSVFGGDAAAVLSVVDVPINGACNSVSAPAVAAVYRVAEHAANTSAIWLGSSNVTADGVEEPAVHADRAALADASREGVLDDASVAAIVVQGSSTHRREAAQSAFTRVGLAVAVLVGGVLLTTLIVSVRRRCTAPCRGGARRGGTPPPRASLAQAARVCIMPWALVATPLLAGVGAMAIAAGGGLAAVGALFVATAAGVALWLLSAYLVPFKRTVPVLKRSRTPAAHARHWPRAQPRADPARGGGAAAGHALSLQCSVDAMTSLASASSSSSSGALTARSGAERTEYERFFHGGAVSKLVKVLVGDQGGGVVTDAAALVFPRGLCPVRVQMDLRAQTLEALSLANQEFVTLVRAKLAPTLRQNAALWAANTIALEAGCICSRTHIYMVQSIINMLEILMQGEREEGRRVARSLPCDTPPLTKIRAMLDLLQSTVAAQPTHAGAGTRPTAARTPLELQSNSVCFQVHSPSVRAATSIATSSRVVAVASALHEDTSVAPSMVNSCARAGRIGPLGPGPSGAFAAAAVAMGGGGPSPPSGPLSSCSVVFDAEAVVAAAQRQRAAGAAPSPIPDGHDVTMLHCPTARSGRSWSCMPSDRSFFDASPAASLLQTPPAAHQRLRCTEASSHAAAPAIAARTLSQDALAAARARMAHLDRQHPPRQCPADMVCSQLTGSGNTAASLQHAPAPADSKRQGSNNASSKHLAPASPLPTRAAAPGGLQGVSGKAGDAPLPLPPSPSPSPRRSAHSPPREGSLTRSTSDDVLILTSDLADCAMCTLCSTNASSLARPSWLQQLRHGSSFEKGGGLPPKMCSPLYSRDQSPIESCIGSSQANQVTTIVSSLDTMTGSTYLGHLASLAPVTPRLALPSIPRHPLAGAQPPSVNSLTYFSVNSHLEPRPDAAGSPPGARPRSALRPRLSTPGEPDPAPSAVRRVKSWVPLSARASGAVGLASLLQARPRAMLNTVFDVSPSTSSGPGTRGSGDAATNSLTLRLNGSMPSGGDSVGAERGHRSHAWGDAHMRRSNSIHGEALPSVAPPVPAVSPGIAGHARRPLVAGELRSSRRASRPWVRGRATCGAVREPVMRDNPLSTDDTSSAMQTGSSELGAVIVQRYSHTQHPSSPGSLASVSSNSSHGDAGPLPFRGRLQTRSSSSSSGSGSGGYGGSTTTSEGCSDTVSIDLAREVGFLPLADHWPPRACDDKGAGRQRSQGRRSRAVAESCSARPDRAAPPDADGSGAAQATTSSANGPDERRPANAPAGSPPNALVQLRVRMPRVAEGCSNGASRGLDEEGACASQNVPRGSRALLPTRAPQRFADDPAQRGVSTAHVRDVVGPAPACAFLYTLALAISTPLLAMLASVRAALLTWTLLVLLYAFTQVAGVVRPRGSVYGLSYTVVALGELVAAVVALVAYESAEASDRAAGFCAPDTACGRVIGVACVAALLVAAASSTWITIRAIVSRALAPASMHQQDPSGAGSGRPRPDSSAFCCGAAAAAAASCPRPHTMLRMLPYSGESEVRSVARATSSSCVPSMLHSLVSRVTSGVCLLDASSESPTPQARYAPKHHQCLVHGKQNNSSTSHATTDEVSQHKESGVSCAGAHTLAALAKPTPHHAQHTCTAAGAAERCEDGER